MSKAAEIHDVLKFVEKITSYIVITLGGGCHLLRLSSSEFSISTHPDYQGY
jgi:hypothetical protein